MTEFVKIQAFKVPQKSLLEVKIQIKTKNPARIIVLGGLPLNEPIVGYASFVMNSMEQIQQKFSTNFPTNFH